MAVPKSYARNRSRVQLWLNRGLRQIAIDLLQNDEKFVTIMGDILTQILMNKAKADEQIRTGNSEEFDLQ